VREPFSDGFTDAETPPRFPLPSQANLVQFATYSGMNASSRATLARITAIRPGASWLRAFQLYVVEPSLVRLPLRSYVNGVPFHVRIRFARS